MRPAKATQYECSPHRSESRLDGRTLGDLVQQTVRHGQRGESVAIQNALTG